MIEAMSPQASSTTLSRILRSLPSIELSVSCAMSATLKPFSLRAMTSLSKLAVSMIRARSGSSAMASKTLP